MFVIYSVYNYIYIYNGIKYNNYNHSDHMHKDTRTHVPIAQM